MSLSDLYRLQLVNCVHQSSLDKVEQVARDLGMPILRLDGSHISDTATFLAQTARDFPTSPDLPPHNLDAFADMFGRELRAMEPERVAIVWTEAQHLLRANLQEFVNILLSLTDLARDAHTLPNEQGRTKAVYLFLAGDGPEFKPFA